MSRDPEEIVADRACEDLYGGAPGSCNIPSPCFPTSAEARRWAEQHVLTRTGPGP